MIGLQDRRALTLAGQHRQSDMVGGQKEGGRWRVARRKKKYMSMFGTGTDLPD